MRLRSSIPYDIPRHIKMWNRVFNKSGFKSEKIKIIERINDLFYYLKKRLETKSKVRAEQRLNLALRSSQTVIFEWDLSTGKIQCSENYAQVFGFERPKKWNLDLYYENVVHPEDRDYTRAVFKKYLEQELEFHTEHRIIWPDRSIHWISTSGLVQKEGHETKLTGIAVDITARKLVEEERSKLLKQSRLDFEKICEERKIRENFVATLSHDLRNPLCAAKISAQLLLKGTQVNDHSRRLVSRVVSSIERTDQMVQDLLDANRIQVGHKLPMTIEFFDLGASLLEVLEELTFIYGKRFSFEQLETVRGYWSKKGLKRVIENLGTNAVKYGEPGSVISLRLFSMGGRVLIKVHNRGKVISREEQSVIFETFCRGKSAEQGNQKGWGLGLTLVRGIVRALGGEVFVESTIEKGTIFTVELPLDARCYQDGPSQNESCGSEIEEANSL